MRNTFINDYFGFNRQQRNGLWVLILISFFLLVLRIAYPYFISPANIVVSNLPLLERRLDSTAEAGGRRRKSFYSYDKERNMFVFDPNTVSMEQLLALGFREKTATTLLKFRQKGFVFKEKKDLQKVYGISDKFYAKLEPYILIKKDRPVPGTVEVTENPAPVTVAKSAVPRVELNTADSLSLVALNGIGPGFARRILKYRSVLGGFVSVEQLQEVYGFPEELYEKIKGEVEVNAAHVKRINLNTDDFKTVNRHPYLSYELTKVIFNQRRKEPLTAAVTKDLLDDETLYNKLAPYLVFN
jgi:competence protein ComEA